MTPEQLRSHLRRGAIALTLVLPLTVAHHHAYRGDLLPAGLGFALGLIGLAWILVALTRQAPAGRVSGAALLLAAAFQCYGGTLIFLDGGDSSPHWASLALGMGTACFLFPFSFRQTLALAVWTWLVYGGALAAFALTYWYLPGVPNLVMRAGFMLVATLAPLVAARDRAAGEAAG